jgi:hypothetical protein
MLLVSMRKGKFPLYRQTNNTQPLFILNNLVFSLFFFAAAAAAEVVVVVLEISPPPIPSPPWFYLHSFIHR